MAKYTEPAAMEFFFFFTLTLFLSSHIAKVFKTPNIPFYVLCPQFPPPPQLFFLPKRISSLLTIMNHKQLVLKICSQAFLISSSPLRSTVKPAVSNGCTLRVHSDNCNDSVSKRKLWRLLWILQQKAWFAEVCCVMVFSSWIQVTRMLLSYRYSTCSILGRLRCFECYLTKRLKKM